MSLNEGNQWNVSDGDISSWSCRALDESQAFTAGPCSTTQPSRAGVAGRGAAQQAVFSNRRQLKKNKKTLICLHTRKHLPGCRRRGRRGVGQVWRSALGMIFVCQQEQREEKKIRKAKQKSASE